MNPTRMFQFLLVILSVLLCTNFNFLPSQHNFAYILDSALLNSQYKNALMCQYTVQCSLKWLTRFDDFFTYIFIRKGAYNPAWFSGIFQLFTFRI